MPLVFLILHSITFLSPDWFVALLFALFTAHLILHRGREERS
jgi:hypothetical protein